MFTKKTAHVIARNKMNFVSGFISNVSSRIEEVKQTTFSSPTVPESNEAVLGLIFLKLFLSVWRFTLLSLIFAFFFFFVLFVCGDRSIDRDR